MAACQESAPSPRLRRLRSLGILPMMSCSGTASCCRSSRGNSSSGSVLAMSRRMQTTKTRCRVWGTPWSSAWTRKSFGSASSSHECIPERDESAKRRYPPEPFPRSSLRMSSGKICWPACRAESIPLTFSRTAIAGLSLPEDADVLLVERLSAILIRVVPHVPRVPGSAHYRIRLAGRPSEENRSLTVFRPDGFLFSPGGSRGQLACRAPCTWSRPGPRPSARGRVQPSQALRQFRRSGSRSTREGTLPRTSEGTHAAAACDARHSPSRLTPRRDTQGDRPGRGMPRSPRRAPPDPRKDRQSGQLWSRATPRQRGDGWYLAGEATRPGGGRVHRRNGDAGVLQA